MRSCEVAAPLLGIVPYDDSGAKGRADFNMQYQKVSMAERKRKRGCVPEARIVSWWTQYVGRQRPHIISGHADEPRARSAVVGTRTPSTLGPDAAVLAESNARSGSDIPDSSHEQTSRVEDVVDSGGQFEPGSAAALPRGIEIDVVMYSMRSHASYSDVLLPGPPLTPLKVSLHERKSPHKTAIQ